MTRFGSRRSLRPASAPAYCYSNRSTNIKSRVSATIASSAARRTSRSPSLRPKRNENGATGVAPFFSVALCQSLVRHVHLYGIGFHPSAIGIRPDLDRVPLVEAALDPLVERGHVRDCHHLRPVQEDFHGRYGLRRDRLSFYFHPLAGIRVVVGRRSDGHGC